MKPSQIECVWPYHLSDTWIVANDCGQQVVKWYCGEGEIDGYWSLTYLSYYMYTHRDDGDGLSIE